MNIAEATAAVRAGTRPRLVRFDSTVQVGIDASSRTVTYVLSTELVARDGATIATAGWDLDAFKANPVFLWAHDMMQPPIGRVTSIRTVGKKLMGDVQYADAATYPFADTVFRLVKGGYLNAVSVSWLPIKYRISTSRPGGVDFQEQELLEVSQVPVPSDPDALATARAAGIDTAPLRRWAAGVLAASERDGGHSLRVREAARLALAGEADLSRMTAKEILWLPLPDTVAGKLERVRQLRLAFERQDAAHAATMRRIADAQRR